MTEPFPDQAPGWYQYLWCAVCLEIQRELSENGKTPELAITIIDGTAACEEHRRRVDGYAQAVRAARRFNSRDQQGYGNRPPRGT